MQASDPALEVVICGPRESFRWAVHDYPHHLAKWHCHPEYELHLIQSTGGRMMIGDHVGAFEPGCLVLTGPNLPHNWVSAIGPDERVRERDMLVQFTGAFAQSLCDGFPEFTDVRTLLSEAAFGIEFTGATAAFGRRKLCEIGHASGPRRLILFLELMAQLAADRRERRSLSHCAPALGLHTAASRRLERVIAFISSNYLRELSLSEAAGVCNMEATAFSRFFKHQTGHNFSFFVNQLRVQHACTLLARSERAITEICYESGYNNTANFNRQFFAVCGQTPSAYRESARAVRQGHEGRVAA
ncbi:AraC family transcriptional regulator [Aureimonas sp. AU12]|uniref:AraC family transcriptional regulator n=1 Tax=Aureimonas sp. AU12 TaxID=1638161 RepID=UPI00078473AF|nr:AraC family transcriptional regulator [Aureimonas sp. AU12]